MAQRGKNSGEPTAQNTNDSAGTVGNDMKSKLAAALAGNAGAAAQSETHDRDRAGSAKAQPASDDVHGNVLQEIEAATGIETEDLVNDKALGHDLGVDSLSLVDLSVRLEERFGVELAESDVQEDTTVRELVNLITRKLGGE